MVTWLYGNLALCNLALRNLALCNLALCHSALCNLALCNLAPCSGHKNRYVVKAYVSAKQARVT